MFNLIWGINKKIRANALKVPSLPLKGDFAINHVSFLD